MGKETADEAYACTHAQRNEFTIIAPCRSAVGVDGFVVRYKGVGDDGKGEKAAEKEGDFKDAAAVEGEEQAEDDAEDADDCICRRTVC